VSKKKIEVEPVDADRLPIEQPITYEDICRIVGTLYLDGIRKSKGIEEQAKSLLNQLNGELESLREENARLRNKPKETVVE
jgi:hypothetical protein|tara:strand:+ start:204 stop:446 length:243 start_codon:yes stop_codon:yes gene_type:complete